MEIVFVLRELDQIISGNLQHAAFILFNLVNVGVALKLGDIHPLMLSCRLHNNLESGTAVCRHNYHFFTRCKPHFRKVGMR
ncbi:hypothetical protein D3C76_1338380 [compost metagenome]